jgi:cell shape-determining protein MreC
MMSFKRSIPSSLIYLIVICSLLFLLSLTGVIKPMRKLIEKALIIPLKEKVYHGQRFFKKDLETCKLANEKELAEMKVKLAALGEENKEQKRLLSAPLPKNWQFLTAKVIGLGEESLTLNIGEAEGAKVGMVALSGQSFLGKVSETSQGMSKVRLASFFEEKEMVRLIGKEGERGLVGQGLLVGKGEGRMKVEQILRSEDIKKGDLVVLGETGENLLVGEVEEVIQLPGETFKTAQVKRLFNPEELQTVFLVRGKI